MRPETDPALREAYLSDPIALWQDGEYEALDRLYRQSETVDTDTPAEPKPSETGTEQDEDDDPIPF